VLQHQQQHLFNSPLSSTIQVSWYQKGKNQSGFTGARVGEWQWQWRWHQIGHVQICTLPQTDNHTSSPPLSFSGRMPFLLPNQ